MIDILASLPCSGRAAPIWNRGDCRCSVDGLQNCDVCLYNVPGTGACCTEFATGPDQNGDPNLFYQILLFQGYVASPLGAAHELLHSFLSRGDLGGTIFVDDEYSAGGAAIHCGHSIMAAIDTTQLCQASNHGRDTSPVGTVADTGPSCWAAYYANQLTYWQPTFEPDTKNLMTYTFSGLSGVIYRRW